MSPSHGIVYRVWGLVSLSIIGLSGSILGQSEYSDSTHYAIPVYDYIPAKLNGEPAQYIYDTLYIHKPDSVTLSRYKYQFKYRMYNHCWCPGAPMKPDTAYARDYSLYDFEFPTLPDSVRENMVPLDWNIRDIDDFPFGIPKGDRVLP